MAGRPLGYAAPLVLIAGALLLGAGCSMKGGSKAAATPEPVAAVEAPERIVAEGKVVPVRGVALSFPLGGVVAEVPVAVGQFRN